MKVELSFDESRMLIAGLGSLLLEVVQDPKLPEPEKLRQSEELDLIMKKLFKVKPKASKK